MNISTLSRGAVTDRPRSRTRLSPIRLGIAALALAAACGAAWYGHDWWVSARFVEATDDAYVGGDVTGISPHVAGFVSAILVTDNQPVKAGQLLVQLDPRDEQAARDHAQAVVDARLAALVNLRAQLTLQQSVIQQTAADLVGRTARAAFTREDGQRYAALASTNAGSRQDAQKAVATDAEAEAAAASAKATLAAAQQRLSVLAAQLTEAGAAIAQAQADLATAELNLGYTDIRAPIDGIVGNRAAQIGAYVAEGGALLSLIPAQGLWVDANFKEDQLAAMAPGQPASVTADAVPGKVFHGHVASLAPATGGVFSIIPAENATGNFTKIVQRVPVRIALDADGFGQLRPGLSTIASVDTKAVP